MEDQVRGRKIAGNGKAGLQGLLVEQELLMVPAQAGADGPVFEPQLVLNECGLFEVGALGREGKGGWSSIIELCGVCDDVAEILMQEGVVCFDADLPFVPSSVPGETCLDVAFAKPLVLEDLDRRGFGAWFEVFRFAAT